MFLRAFFIAAACALLALAAIPRMDFFRWRLFDAEYGMWTAKSELLRQTQGRQRVVILGDSRIVAAYKPVGGGDSPVVNMGLGGGTPVEAYFLLRRLVDSHTRIPLLILSFAPCHLEEAEVFLGRTSLFHFLEDGETEDVLAAQDGTTVLGAGRRSILNCKLRLPMCYAPFFKYLLEPGRAEKGKRFFQETRDSGGWHLFGTETPGKMPVEVGRTAFRPHPVIDAYFNRLLALARERHIPVAFYTTPLSEGAASRVSDTYRAAFQAYLHTKAGLEIVDGGALPLDHIGDGSHVNRQGADAVTTFIDREIVGPHMATTAVAGER